jgi:RimJ/RimL family protein N-acetyltransferase
MPDMSNVEHWQLAQLPDSRTLQGRFVRLEKLDLARHGDGLWAALQGPGSDTRLWDYLPYGPFTERHVFEDFLSGFASSSDPCFYTVIDQATGTVDGYLSLMSIVPAHGRIEIGHVTFGASMQRTPKGTEAVYLLAKESFALGYRRLEWKRAPSVPPSVSALPTKARFASTWWSKATTATRRGIRSSTANGLSVRTRSRPGWRTITSTKASR